MNDDSLQENPLDRLADEFVARYRRGERPALSEYCTLHPELADDIRRVFPTLVVMEQARPEEASGPVRSGAGNGTRLKLERLGDYRILREVARGGMGIVYEAVQESLGRHVALKVLPPQAVLNPRHVERFQREARAAAKLHHTNIVPVFGVGEHDGMYYYVMQFIHGLGLDEVIDEVRHLRERSVNRTLPRSTVRTVDTKLADPGPGGAAALGISVEQIAGSLISGEFLCNASRSSSESEITSQPAHNAAALEGRVVETGVAHSRQLLVDIPPGRGPCVPASGDIPTDPALDGPRCLADSATFRVRPPSDESASGLYPMHDTTSLSQSGSQYWQSVARIGVQVAEALEYASGQGVLHRDIKPSNLLLDRHGTVWVTDFGLAKVTDHDDLTHPGDIVGTLRYLAPERPRGEMGLRGDIYSLGVTLYEMLALRPPFQDHDQSRLMRRILEEEPVRPREIDANVPADLETIVLKAIAKDPADRYQKPGELAADLRQFLDDKPIAARPVGRIERTWRWCRRNPRIALLTASVASLLVAVTLISFLSAIWLKRERDTARTAERSASAAEQKASAAEAAQRQELYRAYLNDAYATLLTGRPGQRIRGLNSIQKILTALPADELTPEKRTELRDQAIAHLAVGDVREVARLPGVSFHRGRPVIDETLDLVFASAEHGSGTVIRRVSDPSFRIELAIEGPDQGQFPTLRSLSPSGRWLAEFRRNPESDPDWQLVVWDWRAKQVIFSQPSVGIRFAFHPNDRQLLFEHYTAKLAIVDLPTGQIITESPRRFVRGIDVAFNPDGRWLAVTSPDLVTEIVDIATWQTVALLPEAGKTLSVAWHPFEPYAVFGTREGRIYLWDSQTRSGRFLSYDWIGLIHHLGFSPDGRYLASSGLDLHFHVRRMDHDRVLVKSPGDVLRLSRDGGRLAVIQDDNTLVIYELVDPAAYWRIPQHVEIAEFSSDGNWLAVTGDNGVQLYSANSLTKKADLGLDHCGPVAFHPDGKSLVTFGTFSHAQRWPLELSANDPASWRIGPPESLMHGSGVDLLLWGPELEPQHLGRHPAFSRDGRVLALADARHHRILIADADSAGPPRVFAPFPSILWVAVSPDGQWIAAAGYRGSSSRHTGVFRTADAEAILDLPDHARVSFSPDGDYFASSSLTEVRLYRIASWELERSIPVDRPPNLESAPIAFQPNGRLLAVADSFHRTRLYDRVTGHNVANLTHSLTDNVHCNWLSFSPDGTRLAVTGFLNNIGIWDLSELRVELAELGLGVVDLPQRRQTTDRMVRGNGSAVMVDRGQQLVPREHWYKFWQLLATHEASRANWPDAIDDINNALRQPISPIGRDRAELLQARGTYHLRNGDARAARDDWREATSLAPDLTGATRGLARLHVLGPPEHRDPQRSWALITPLAAATSPDPEDLLILGAAQVRLGNHELGLATLQRVTNTPALQPYATFLIAIAKYHVGLLADAKLWYEQAVDAIDRSNRTNPELAPLREEAASLLELSNR